MTKTTDGNVVINISTASEVPPKNAGVALKPLGVEVIKSENGSFGSITSGRVMLPVGSKVATGTIESTISPDTLSSGLPSEALVTEQPINGEEVGLEIVHHGGVTKPEVGLEIGPVDFRTTSKPGKPDIITEGEPSTGEEIIDGVPPKKPVTKTPTTATSEAIEGSGESTPSGSTIEVTTSPSSTSEIPESSGELPTVPSNYSTTTEQPDLVLSMGTPKEEITTGTPSGSTESTPSSSTSTGTTSSGEGSSATTEQPDLVLSMGTTVKTDGSTTVLSTPENVVTAGESTEVARTTTSGATKEPKSAESPFTTPLTTTSERTSSSETSTTVTAFPTIVIDETEGSGVEKDERPEQRKPPAAVSSTTEESSTPTTAKPSTRTDSFKGNRITTTTSAEPAGTTTPTSTLSTTTNISSSVETTSVPATTASSSSSTTGTSSSETRPSSSSAAPEATETPEVERKDIVGPSGESQRE
ncbi:unnamed protein product, partial [Strongylus vulgaris]